MNCHEPRSGFQNGFKLPIAESLQSLSAHVPERGQRRQQMKSFGLTLGAAHQCAIEVADSPELTLHFHARLCGEIIKSMGS